MIIRSLFIFLIFAIPLTFLGQSTIGGFIGCKDTNYFVRTKFVYCDSMQPTSFVFKNGKLYERKKHNYENEDVLANCKTAWSDAKYFIFTTKSGKKIEEGFYSGIWEMTFCKGEYKG